MSGVTEVRLLYCNTVDEVPLEYTNVTAVVLNSSTKNHATGVKQYLDGVTTVSGLDPGTHYFWVQLIDASGNTAGPQPAGSYTTPSTVWEFFCIGVNTSRFGTDT
jgi:predicted phage tail protein